MEGQGEQKKGGNKQKRNSLKTWGNHNTIGKKSTTCTWCDLKGINVQERGTFGLWLKI